MRVKRHSTKATGGKSQSACRVVLLCSFLAWTGGSLRAAPVVTRMWFSPPVVPQTQTQPVLFEATVSENPGSVTFEYDGVDRNMYDDGTHGDRVVNDGTWAIEFQPNEILSKLTPARVYRPFIGFCKPAGGGRYNIFAEVWTSDIGLVGVTPLGPDAQETEYLVNFTATKSQLLNFDAAYWARRFFAVNGDDFDFLNFLLIAGERGNRYHFQVKNDVQGIGSSVFDRSASYGSAGRLMGFTVYPLPSFFDLGETTFSHETGHQWINFLAGTPFASGIPHWPRGSVATSIMGFSIPGSGAGGIYNYTFVPDGSGGFVVGSGNPANQITYNSMELYLMGLVPPGEVETYFVLRNQNQELTVGQVLSPAQITPVTVNDVIAVSGPRVPSSSNSQKTFRCATVALSEQLLDDHALSFYDWFARRAEATEPLRFASGFATGTCNPFFLATGRRASMFSRIQESSARFSRGDANADGEMDIGDPLLVLFYLFENAILDCQAAADTDDDGKVSTSDAISLLAFIFLNGPQPQPPFPACGVDRSPGELACESFQPCQ